MKLTKQDIEYLKEQYHENDANISQIRRTAIHIGQTTDNYGTTLKRVTHEEARQLLGGQRYLGAIDRCVFHNEATCSIEGNSKVLYFERRL